ncbi:hypothetical protein GW17_00031027 [Ensete ventricosum]|nr:hypothetical protein GW17_00031027 [Ensete ventricosum]
MLALGKRMARVVTVSPLKLGIYKERLEPQERGRGDSLKIPSTPPKNPSTPRGDGREANSYRLGLSTSLCRLQFRPAHTDLASRPVYTDFSLGQLISTRPLDQSIPTSVSTSLYRLGLSASLCGLQSRPVYADFSLGQSMPTSVSTGSVVSDLGLEDQANLKIKQTHDLESRLDASDSARVQVSGRSTNLVHRSRTSSRHQQTD